MSPDPESRDQIFKAFGRAFFKRDVPAMYEVVTPDFAWTVMAGEELRVLDSPEQVAAFFEERAGTQESVRFHDVVYHHAPDATFMTYRVTGTEKATGAAFERVGVERYTFRDGRIAVKDVYSRPGGSGS